MQRCHRKAHARIWAFLALFFPFAIALILLARPDTTADRPAVLLEEPP